MTIDRPRTFPSDAELTSLVIEDERPLEIAPGRPPTTPGEWIRQSLFSGPFNSVLTVVLVLALGYLVFTIVRWLFLTADFTVVKANFRVYMIGRFPLEEAWRVWMAVYLVAALSGLSWGAWEKRLVWDRARIIYRVVLAALAVGFFVYVLEGGRIWALTLAVPAIVAIGVPIGRAGGRSMRRPLGIAWLLAFPAVVLVLRLFGGVPPQLWGGFLLNALIAVVAIFVSFPLGILLALGRRSTLPAMRTVCVGVIEVIRGVPLFTLIIVSFNILPLMLPPGTQLALIVRIMFMFTIFSAAYVAEIVRGGLQGVHEGQYEAARALGLSTSRMMALIVLPQALRSTIPAMISHFISLFKDTSLVSALAILEMLRASRRAANQIEFLGHQKEALLVAALVFWIVAFSMSRWSQRLERRLGVGER